MQIQIRELTQLYTWNKSLPSYAIKTCLFLLVPMGLTSIAVHAEEKTQETSDQLMERNQEILRLQQEIERIRHQHASEPKTVYIGNEQLKKYHYANYYKTTVQKLERIGTLHFPQLTGELRETVKVKVGIKINADGSLKDVKLLAPSSNKEINEAVIKIAKLAAPYAPFSEEMKKESDVVVIINLWEFRPKAETGISNN